MTEVGGELDDDQRPLGGPREVDAPPPLFRDTIESFTLAIIIALVVKSFLAEAYKVPTGSMEPTIHGSAVDGDRILVNKLAALVSSPERWETWVFQYPNNRRVNYVKRFVGIGPEAIRIVAGDVYHSPLGTADLGTAELWQRGDLEIARKPDRLRNATFDRYEQIHEEATTFGDPDYFNEYWLPPRPDLDDDSSWNLEGGLHIETSSRSWVHYRNSIKDRLDLWAPVSPTNHEGTNEVGDLRIDLEVVPESDSGRLLLQIRDAELSEFIEARIPFGDDEREPGLYLGDERLADLGGFRLARGEKVDVRFANADDRLTLEIDGEMIASANYRHEPLAAVGVMRWPARVSFGIESGSALFRSAQVARDIYYRGGGGRGRSIFDPAYESWSVDVPDDSYFVLGDNSPASNDSREWRRKTIFWVDEKRDPISGDFLAVIDPDQLDLRQENPYTETVADRSRRVFIDEFGNRRLIDDYGPIREIRDLPSPLVPRSLLVGRAFAIFLPLKRMRIVR